MERLRTIVEQYCSTANCSTAVLSRFPTSVSLALLSRTLRLASQARQEGGWGQPPNNGRLRTIVEQCCSTANCSTAVLSRFPTSVSLTLLSRTLRLASQARQEDGWGQPPNNGRLRTIVEQYCSTANCSTAVLSRFPTSVSLALLSRPLRLASQARQEGGWGQPPNNVQCSTAVLSRFPTSVSLALLSRNSQTRLASSAGGRLGTTAEQWAMFNGCPQPFSYKR